MSVLLSMTSGGMYLYVILPLSSRVGDYLSLVLFVPRQLLITAASDIPIIHETMKTVLRENSDLEPLRHFFEWDYTPFDLAIDGNGASGNYARLMLEDDGREAVHGVGPHTISVPRVKRADDIDPDMFDNGIDDETFTKIAACIRLAVPYTGMIISTRESEQVRKRMLQVGISQISGASRTSVGGYTEAERPHDTEQFDVSDQRTLDEVVRWLMESGHIPSFCTACYREGRTGDRFMALCKNGQILNCCHPNALMTLAEYLEDYASPETKETGYRMIEEELKKIPKDKVREITREHIAEIRSSNRRDFRF